MKIVWNLYCAPKRVGIQDMELLLKRFRNGTAPYFGVGIMNHGILSIGYSRTQGGM